MSIRHQSGRWRCWLRLYAAQDVSSFHSVSPLNIHVHEACYVCGLELPSEEARGLVQVLVPVPMPVRASVAPQVHLKVQRLPCTDPLALGMIVRTSAFLSKARKAYRSARITHMLSIVILRGRNPASRLVVPIPIFIPWWRRSGYHSRGRLLHRMVPAVPCLFLRVTLLPVHDMMFGLWRRCRGRLGRGCDMRRRRRSKVCLRRSDTVRGLPCLRGAWRRGLHTPSCDIHWGAVDVRKGARMGDNRPGMAHDWRGRCMTHCLSVSGRRLVLRMLWGRFLLLLEMLWRDLLLHHLLMRRRRKVLHRRSCFRLRWGRRERTMDHRDDSAHKHQF